MPKPTNQKPMTNGEEFLLNGEWFSNSEALELLLDALEVQPSVAQVALGRSLAKQIDHGGADLKAAMVSEYRDWLAGVEAATPDEPDALDAAQ